MDTFLKFLFAYSHTRFRLCALSVEPAVVPEAWVEGTDVVLAAWVGGTDVVPAAWVGEIDIVPGIGIGVR